MEFEVNTDARTALPEWPDAKPIQQGDTLSIDGGPVRRVKSVRPNRDGLGVTVECEPTRELASSASRSS
jgi:hypothetical protein